MVQEIHFIVYGVGAVGGMYGAQLLAERNWQNLDYQVSFVARNETYNVLDKDGIKFHVKTMMVQLISLIVKKSM
jgi:ketopantoate reductase